MEQQNLFKTRDKRKKGWFFMDNDYLNGYAKFFGAIGTAIYVSLCRHADSESQKCYPSVKLISEELTISNKTVIKYLKLFVKYNLIAVSKGNRNTKQQWQNNEYLLLDKSEWIKPSEPITHGFVPKPSVLEGESQVYPVHTKETNKNKDNTSIRIEVLQGKSPDENHDGIVQVFEKFQQINPTINYGHKTNRKAANDLIKKFGLEKTLRTVDFAIQVQSKKYAPIITTPYQLKEKFSQLMVYYYRENNNKLEPKGIEL